MPFFDPTSLYRLLAALGVPTSDGFPANGTIPGFPNASGASPVGGLSSGAEDPIGLAGTPASGSASSNPGATPISPAVIKRLRRISPPTTAAAVASPPAPASAAGSPLSPAIARMYGKAIAQAYGLGDLFATPGTDSGTGSPPTSLPAAPQSSSQPYLTPAEMAGPVARDSGGLTPTHIAAVQALQALGLLTPEDGLNFLGILNAALQGASALGGAGGQPQPRQAPAVGGGPGKLGIPYPQQPNNPIQVAPLPRILGG